MSSSMRRGSFVAIALTVLGLGAGASWAPQTARAQELLLDGGASFRLFRPAVDSKGLLSVEGTDILGHTDISFGLVLDYGRSLYRDPALLGGSQDTSSVIDNYFTGTFSFNIGLFNHIVLGLQIPVHVVDGIEGISVGSGAGPSYVAPDGGLSFQSIGDLVLHAKWRILRSDRMPIGLAAILSAELPTGEPESFAGDGFALWPRLAAEWAPSRRFRVDFNVGFRLAIGEGTRLDFCDSTPDMMTGCPAGDISSFDYGSAVTYGVGASWRAASAIDIVLEGYGNAIVGGLGDGGARALPFEVVGGLKIFVERNSYLMIGGGTGIMSQGFDAAEVRAFIGFIFEPSIGDRDGDGLRDDVDECPDDPEDQDDFEDTDGCPDPDNDRDGILDDDDDCPLVPEDRDGDADEDGCPEGNEGDRDGDGILDNVDQCPDDPEDRDQFEDENGCPDPDNDQDGILDGDDLCPNDPEDRDGFEDENGCPDPDNDQDRILDVNDSCVNDPETYNGTEDEDGCPDRGSVIVEDDQIIILEKIYFETDSAVIQERSFPIIEAVARTLVGNPQIRLVEIQGHADERATDEYNIRLTRDRAAAVLEAIVQRGVERSRLRSAGYGERCPVDPRHNDEAWERNRRVEFKILQTEAGPTGVEVACPAGRELIPD
ncbi:MAG: OmpA family protein [Deltaproteobacteria bacterium]|nr:OmpA family protein [Deltaproteobacteria bacterium]